MPSHDDKDTQNLTNNQFWGANFIETEQSGAHDHCFCNIRGMQWGESISTLIGEK